MLYATIILYMPYFRQLMSWDLFWGYIMKLWIVTMKAHSSIHKRAIFEVRIV